MPNGTSLIGTARTMTDSVSTQLEKIQASKEEYLKHLESRKAHLESLLRDSGQDEVRQMLAEVQTAIDAIKQSIPEVAEARENAVKIEARL